MATQLNNEWGIYNSFGERIRNHERDELNLRAMQLEYDSHFTEDAFVEHIIQRLKGKKLSDRSYREIREALDQTIQPVLPLRPLSYDEILRRHDETIQKEFDDAFNKKMMEFLKEKEKKNEFIDESEMEI